MLFVFYMVVYVQQLACNSLSPLALRAEHQSNGSTKIEVVRR